MLNTFIKMISVQSQHNFVVKIREIHSFRLYSLQFRFQFIEAVEIIFGWNMATTIIQRSLAMQS